MKKNKMKIARISMDMSQQELADKVGATRQTIGMIESGKYNPTLNLCIAICKALGKTLDEIFWEEETKEEKKTYTESELREIMKTIGNMLGDKEA
ncbi:MAG: helix-turn-helix transcriptional regulator [Firmicutes bacterium]|nr:helix-turn-helix transcriptional regulator [Bacillota bacterium]